MCGGESVQSLLAPRGDERVDGELACAGESEGGGYCGEGEDVFVTALRCGETCCEVDEEERTAHGYDGCGCRDAGACTQDDHDAADQFGCHGEVCCCGCHGDTHLFEGSDGARRGPFECFLGSVHDHDEAENESEDEQAGGFHGVVVHAFKLDM